MSMNYSPLGWPGYIIRTALWVNCRKSSRLRRMRRVVVAFLHSLCDRICCSRPGSVVGSGTAFSSGFFTHREKNTERIVYILKKSFSVEGCSGLWGGVQIWGEEV